MTIYKNILVVVDLSTDSDLIIERAKAIAESGANLTLLHVVEYMQIEPMSETLMPTAEIETELTARADARLRELIAAHGLTRCTPAVIVGAIKTEIQHHAVKTHADLIIVGNHGRQGLKALLNFTEDAVLHRAPCDVLAVRLPPSAPNALHNQLQ